jgi:hypothetical protein
VQISRINELLPMSPSQPQATPSVGGGSGGPSFGEVLRNTKEDFLGGNLHGLVNDLQVRMQRGEQLKPGELISAQIAMTHLSTRVELVSRVAESAVSTVRRLQQQ